jgi:hypothetical protein
MNWVLLFWRMCSPGLCLYVPSHSSASFAMFAFAPTLVSSKSASPKMGGCAGCWAVGYCAAFSPASPRPPAACPLIAKPDASARATTRQSTRYE